MQSSTQAGFAKDSWQTPRNARSLRAFMALRNQEIAARLRELRGKKPQTTVADELGVAERTYQNWEAGEAKPSYRNLQRLAEYFGVREDYILAGASEHAPSPFAGQDAIADRLDAIERALADARAEREQHAEHLEQLLRRQ